MKLVEAMARSEPGHWSELSDQRAAYVARKPARKVAVVWNAPMVVTRLSDLVMPNHSYRLRARRFERTP